MKTTNGAASRDGGRAFPITNGPRWGIAWAFTSRERSPQRLTTARRVVYLVTFAAAVSTAGVVAFDTGWAQ